jgi:hypothetical protein
MQTEDRKLLGRAAPAASTVAPSLCDLYPDARHFVVDIGDDSMNATTPWPILKGAKAICIETRGTGLKPETGKLYMVRRWHDGRNPETLIRRAKVSGKRVEFYAESTNEAYAGPPIVLDPIEIDVMGLVYQVGFDFEAALH